MTEGTWSSAGYESARSRMMVTVALLGLNIIGSVVAMYVVGIEGAGVVDRSISGPNAELLRWADTADTLALGGIALYLATAIAFLAWLHRTVANVPHLGGGTPKWSPGWSVGWWFVPLASFVMPYLVVRDVMRRLAAAVRYGGIVLIVWWISFVAANVGGRAVDFLPLDSLADFRTALLAAALLELPLIIAALAAIWLLVAIQRASDARVSEALFRDGMPAPSAATRETTAEERRAALLDELLGDHADPAGARTPERVTRGLGKLKEQLYNGTITSAEYESKRADLLSGL